MLRVWTGFRAATPDKLPLIGPFPGDPTLWLATGHEGLGITTALATAELLAAAFIGSRTAIAPEPYLPARFWPAREPGAPYQGNATRGEAMNWTGVMPAMTTAFDKDFNVDHAFVARHAQWLIENGCTGIICLGSLGEAAHAAISGEDRILKTVVAALDGKAPTVAAISALSTAEAVELAKAAHAVGCAGLMILPPYVYKGDWRENKAHVAAILKPRHCPACCTTTPSPTERTFCPSRSPN